jgi:hypothetical protein
MRPGIIALLTALIPILAIHTCYLVAAHNGHVPWCIPYIDSCTSISATGRQNPEYFIFKASMIPAAMLMMLFWFLCYEWLQNFDTRNGIGVLTIPILGIVAAVFLILYTTMLGAVGELYQLERRIGVIVYFTFTYLAQLIFTYQVNQLNKQRQVTSKYLFGSLLSLNILVLLIGILSLILQLLITNYDLIEDAFEWVLALLIHVYFLVVFRLWQKTDFRVFFQVSK